MGFKKTELTPELIKEIDRVAEIYLDRHIEEESKNEFALFDNINFDER
jgi:hypothetical protein